jgi:hypothetical protein
LTKNIENGAKDLPSHGKREWQAPRLSSGKVADITEGDYTSIGNDGGPTTHATGFTS